MKTKAELKNDYKNTPVPMGVFLVRNTLTNEFLMGSSRNLEGSLNKHRFMLQMGRSSDSAFVNPKMIEDYRKQGEASFEFKILYTLKPKDELDWDPSDDLKALEKMWLEELKNKGWILY
jgi:hypothetical protein